MIGDVVETEQCQVKDPVDLFHAGQVVKICAPMVRYSKLAFRTLVRKYNCDLCYTPMIVAADFVRSAKARDSEFTTNKGDHPLIVQFAAKEAQVLCDAARIVCPFADGIDLNCGCPQRWAMAEGYGASLINKPELVRDMVRHVRNQIDNPRFSVSIKIRIHEDLKRTVDLCQKAEASGVSWITVHGRNVEERHQPVHYDAIKIIKQSMSIPIVANGDIKTLKDAENVHHLTGADGIMVARGLLANPAMFAGYEETPLKCIQDWVDIALEHGTPFTCFHHHLMYMMERITSKQEKKVFNVLSSTSSVLDYLNDHYGRRRRLPLPAAPAGGTGSPAPKPVPLARTRPRSLPAPSRVARRHQAQPGAGTAEASAEMTFQWTAVAIFLYGEIAVILVLCLPFISPLRWQKIFMIPLWSKMAIFWNKAFLTIIVLLIVLFLDAIREVKKYSAAHVSEKAVNVNTNAFDHIQMKLFRSQRNLYLSGFSLFLWLVLRRTVTLLTQLAKGMATQAALELQVNNTTEAAKKYITENEMLQQALNEKGSGKKKESAEATDEKLKKEIVHLKAELQKTSDAHLKVTNELTAVKKQSEGLKREYDRLMKEHEQLQNSLGEAEDKKDL
ncbi:tRNA-dihydrouridine(20a/20b) synthase [NAD(P)+]-like [Apteryx mantelli]|uniref:tRNA-dihydrouridine(20a/20b) synthase [NAD(P)+]-like n=2 Tax=Apteryx TaxID=8821 RepID=A0ABM4ES03_9AVES